MVELAVLAEGLRACEDCEKALQLTTLYVSEKRHGLGSLPNISCSSVCGQLNFISTDKSHRSAISRRKFDSWISHIFASTSFRSV